MKNASLIAAVILLQFARQHSVNLFINPKTYNYGDNL